MVGKPVNIEMTYSKLVMTLAPTGKYGLNIIIKSYLKVKLVMTLLPVCKYDFQYKNDLP